MRPCCRHLLGWLMVGVGIGGATVACSRPPARPAAVALPTLTLQPLLRLSPAPGLRWFVRALPRALDQGGLAPAFHQLFPTGGLERLSAAWGVSVRNSPEIVFGSFSATTLTLVRLPRGASVEEALTAFGQRLLPPSGRTSFRPDVVRVWGSLADGERGSAAGFWAAASASSADESAGDVLAIERGRLGPVLASIGLATGKVSESRSATADRSLSALVDWSRPSPFSWVARCPLSPEMERASVVLRECEGMAVRLEGSAKEADLYLRITGAWGRDAELAATELERLLDTARSSRLGHLLGLEAIPAPHVVPGAGALEAHVRFDALALASAFRAAVMGNLDEVLR